MYTGKLIAGLYLISPFVMVLFSFFGWEPFASMPWYWQFSPWIWMLFLIISTGIVMSCISQTAPKRVQIEAPSPEQLKAVLEALNDLESKRKEDLH